MVSKKAFETHEASNAERKRRIYLKAKALSKAKATKLPHIAPSRAKSSVEMAPKIDKR